MARSHVGPEVAEIISSIKRGNRRITPLKQRALGVVTNVGAMAGLLDTLVKQHAKLVAGSAFASPRERMELKLVNTATTPSKNGRGFRYFDAVDRGRSAVHMEDSFLIFGESTDSARQSKKAKGDPYADVVFRAMTGAAPPADITGQALATIRSTLPREAVEAFRAFLNKQDFEQVTSGRRTGGRIGKQRKAVRLGDVAVRGTVSRDVNSPRFVPSAIEERSQQIRHYREDIKLLPSHDLPRILAADPEAQQQMLDEARDNARVFFLQLKQQARLAGQDADAVYREAVHKGQERARAELEKFQHDRAGVLRQYAAGSSKALRQVFPRYVQTSKKNSTRFNSMTDAKTLRAASKQVQALLENTSYTRLVNVFKPLLQAQIQAFKDATPSRAESGLYKLEPSSKGAGPASGIKGKRQFGYKLLKPETGGSLRESYTFMTDDQFNRFARKLTKK